LSVPRDLGRLINRNRGSANDDVCLSLDVKRSKQYQHRSGHLYSSHDLALSFAIRSGITTMGQDLSLPRFSVDLSAAKIARVSLPVKQSQLGMPPSEIAYILTMAKSTWQVFFEKIFRTKMAYQSVNGINPIPRSSAFNSGYY
jgi:hypothetical protein